MAKWGNATLQKCKAVDDIMTRLREKGANIEELRDPTADQTLDQGERVLNDDALWDALPPQIGSRVMRPKEEIRRRLRYQLDSSR